MRTLSNALVYLIGFAGAGKLTTARALAGLIDARIVDNHWINDPVFKLIRADGLTPLPPAIWPRTDEIRAAVCETVATLSPPEWNFVFTNVLREGDAHDLAIYRVIEATAARRRALFVPVTLVCAGDELARRVTAAERRAAQKDVNPARALDRAANEAPLRPPHPNALTVDNTALEPAATAARIAEHALAIARRGDAR